VQHLNAAQFLSLCRDTGLLEPQGETTVCVVRLGSLQAVGRTTACAPALAFAPCACTARDHNQANEGVIEAADSWFEGSCRLHQ